MSDFICIEDFKGKNLLSQEIFIPFDTEINMDGKYLYFEEFPFCTKNSHVARRYFVWNGDGNAVMRKAFEEAIIFSPREKEWKITVPVLNEKGEIIRYDTVTVFGRYTPEEVAYIKEHFPNLVKDKQGLEWSDLFYIGSDINELKELAAYVSK